MSKSTALALLIVFAILTIVFCLLAIFARIQPSGAAALNATATYGAEQFHIQLTAQAVEGK